MCFHKYLHLKLYSFFSFYVMPCCACEHSQQLVLQNWEIYRYYQCGLSTNKEEVYLIVTIGQWLVSYNLMFNFTFIYLVQENIEHLIKELKSPKYGNYYICK